MNPPTFDYFKYHGLGNDYLVIPPAVFGPELSPELVRALCDRHRGPGSDGVLLGPLPPEALGVSGGRGPALRIFNPDGSEGEKSGNGLRIFARYLWEHGLAPERNFSIHTKGGTVQARVLNAQGSRIAMSMGPVRFHSTVIPVTGAPREVLGETLHIAGRDWLLNAATVGNPHCVVQVEEPTEALAREIGPLLERHPWFPNRTNVQFLKVLDSHAIRIEIWERGAGYTQASGTSSCASAAVACRLGLCRSPVTVHMPGGMLEIRLDQEFQAEMEGEVRAVAAGRLAGEFLELLNLRRRNEIP
ncbi:MAG: diaminopimelate epimerase [Deltaproteobacteria bacterium]|nr:diaminopimelate epimerase [Deltaproteobacteria bacterium]